MHKSMLHLTVVGLLAVTQIASAYSDVLINEEVITYINASSQLVIVEHKIIFKNNFTEPMKSYHFIVDPQWMRNLSYIKAVDKRGNSLAINRVNTDQSWLRFEIIFHNPLPSGQTETINLNSVFINYLQSYPKAVKQDEEHLVLFSFNVYYYSEYFTQNQTTFLYLGTNKITSIVGEKSEIITDSNYLLKYGPYNNVSPASEYPSIIHYENSSPFLSVEKLDRFIRISHWGYIIVWEHITLVHTGPKFEGPYERPVSKAKSDTRIESFTTTLPGNAFDIYIKDEIGLIWSFDVDYSDPFKVEVTVKPRFVMYGGWKTQYEIGYSLPIGDFVSRHDDSIFTLSIPIVEKIFPNMIVKEAEINIILPEGASYQYIDPFLLELENNTDNRFCYFLDIICREVVSFKQRNLLEYHINDVSVTYSYLQVYLLTKPLTIALLLICVFMLFIVISHPNWILHQNEETEPGVSSYQVSTKEVINQKNRHIKIKTKKC